jgi:GGDEF domain-containing protein
VPTRVEGIAEVAGIVDRHLAQCRRHRSLLALVCVGVDVVDTESGLGLVPEEVERRVHEEVIHRVCSRVRGGDTVLRPNDRDACVLLHGTSAEALKRVSARLRLALNGDYRIDGVLVRVCVRIGSAAHPDDGAQAPELLRRATGW